MLRASAETWAGVSKKVQISPVHSLTKFESRIEMSIMKFWKKWFC